MTSATPRKRHNVKTCQHCDNEGFRLDFFGADHYGVDTAPNRACAAGVKPCRHHRCYYAGTTKR